MTSRRLILVAALVIVVAAANGVAGSGGEPPASAHAPRDVREVFALRAAPGNTPVQLHPARTAEWGDPNFVPNAEVQTLAEQYREIFAGRLDLSAAEIAKARTIVAGGTTTVIPADGGFVVGDADAVDASGSPSEAGRYCRIRVTSAWQASSVALRRGTIAHEVFHCLQFDIAGYERTLKMPRWLKEGAADWASLEVVPGAWTSQSQAEYGSFVSYLLGCESKPLTARSYDAVGFYGHVDQVYGTTSAWARIKDALTANDDETRFALLGGKLKYFLDTWAARSVNRPLFGLEWETLRPVKPLPQLGCAPEIIDAGGAGVKAEPFTRGQYLIEGPPPANKPVLIVSVVGNGRLSDGKLDTNDVRLRKFCVGAGCRCGGDPPGEPPPYPYLELPALLSLSSGIAKAHGQVLYMEGEKCAPGPPPPPPDATPPPPGASGGSPGGTGSGGGSSGGTGSGAAGGTGGAPGGGTAGGSGLPSGCVGRGCGTSMGEPHLYSFDGFVYDFHGAGEYVLARSTVGGLEVQVRQEPYSRSRNVAVNTAVAARVASDRVVITRGAPPTVRVNGRPLPTLPRSLRLPGGGTIRSRNGQIDVVWPDGSFLRTFGTSSLLISALLWPAPEHVGKVSGLLGNLDGNARNDARPASGRPLDPGAVRRRDARGYRLLYRVFGDSWRVRPRTSLFDYDSKRDTRSYTNRRFPRKVFVTADLAKSSRDRATRTCTRAGIRSRAVFENCVLDVALTRNSQFATDAALLERISRKVEPARTKRGRTPDRAQPPAGVADPRWTLLSSSRDSPSNRHVPSLALDRGRVVVAELATQTAAQAVTFTPSAAKDVVSPARQAIATTAAPNVVSSVHLLARDGGGLQALVEGIPRLGISFAARDRDGRFAPPALASDNVRATAVGQPVLSPNGQPLWPASYGGNLWIWRGVTGAVGADLGQILPGSEGFPSLGRDSTGRYWLTWYQLAPRADESGAYIAQLDPGSLRLIGAPERAPSSSSPANNNRRATLACAGTCRLVYLQKAGAKTRLVSWAKGEGAPKRIALVKSSTVLYPVATHTPGGRLWTAWWNAVTRRYEATMGDGAGAGGKVLGVGRPVSSGDVSAAAAIASGNDLVLVVNWVRGPSSSRFVNVVRSR